MISATEARIAAEQNGKADAIAYCKKWTEFSIKKAMEAGRTRTCLAYTRAWVKDKWLDCESEIKSWLRDCGYHFEPTGYVGGVWQTTEDICW